MILSPYDTLGIYLYKLLDHEESMNKQKYESWLVY
jgi:hypothetical protein